jgi:chromodomain-helicase-DNA-binding protein 7
VLADEMGLGKTIMTMSFLDHMAKIWKIRGPFIVIAPLSTLDHWKKVAEEWTQMNVVVYHDQKGWEGRQEIQRWEWFYTDITNKGTLSQKSRITKFNIMITSYEVFN